MTTKAKLAFDMLEKEMEVISLEQMGLFKGGYDSNSYNSNGSNPPGRDCFFYAFSGLLGQMGMNTSPTALEELYNAKYGSHASDGGVPVSREKEFMSAYFAGCGVVVQNAGLSDYDSDFFKSQLAMGHKFIANIDNHDGTVHAVTITGIDSDGNYLYVDGQNNNLPGSVAPSDVFSGIRAYTVTSM